MGPDAACGEQGRSRAELLHAEPVSENCVRWGSPKRWHWPLSHYRSVSHTDGGRAKERSSRDKVLPGEFRLFRGVVRKAFQTHAWEMVVRTGLFWWKAAFSVPSSPIPAWKKANHVLTEAKTRAVVHRLHHGRAEPLGAGCAPTGLRDPRGCVWSPAQVSRASAGEGEAEREIESLLPGLPTESFFKTTNPFSKLSWAFDGSTPPANDPFPRLGGQASVVEHRPLHHPLPQ